MRAGDPPESVRKHSREGHMSNAGTQTILSTVVDRPSLRRAIVAVPFFAAIGLAIRLDRGPMLSIADAAHPEFVLRDATRAAGITFVHQRPTLT